MAKVPSLTMLWVGATASLVVSLALVVQGGSAITYVAAGIQFLLGSVGVLMSYAPPGFVERHKKLLIFGFVGFGMVGMFAALRQNIEAERDSAAAKREATEARVKLSNAIDGLDRASRDISAEQARSAELTRQLVKSSEMNVALSRETIGNVTGGDSFGYLQFIVDGDVAQPVAMVQGRFPLYNVDIRIFNATGAGSNKVGNLTASDFEKWNLRFPSTFNLHPEGVSMFLGKSLQLGQYGSEQRHSVFLIALNGGWSQSVIWRRIQGEWKYAYRVTHSRKPGTLKERIPDGFGPVEWNNPGSEQ